MNCLKLLRIIFIGTILTQSECRMQVVQKTLSNGLTILVKQHEQKPNVSLQLWYNVGSKDEQTGERGLAHLIEHMIFKGTKQMLSESDIKAVVQKLSGSSNAFTSYDYTGYMFDVPVQNWQLLLPIMADCMVNAAFKDEHLNSEMKAVIQELKRNKDNNERTLWYELLTAIFSDHPYHYPLIGYKQDLWSVRGADLERFYKKHYLPNNAILVVVGDVDPQEVFDAAEQAFGHIAPNNEYKRSIFYHNADIACKGVTIYRDVQQPFAIQAYVTPGAGAQYAHVIDTLSLVLTAGKNARLYKKLVDELQLVTAIASGDLDLFDYGLLLIQYVPKNVADLPKIEQVIADELADIAENGVHMHELQAALKKAKVNTYALLEQNQAQATTIAKYYLATGDPMYAFTYLNRDPVRLNEELKAFVRQYLRSTIMHRGLLLPLPANERAHWLALQKQSDVLDDQMLSSRIRTHAFEPTRYANTVEPRAMRQVKFPYAHSFVLPNGIDVSWSAQDDVPLVTIMCDFKAKSYFDPEDKQGLLAFVARMMREGTTQYTAAAFAQELDAHGMSLMVYPGGISLTMLKDDVPKGLQLLQQLLMHVAFDPVAIERVRTQMLTELQQFWDEPRSFAWQLLDELVYKGHPFAKNSMGTAASLAAITREDLIAWYKACIVPDNTYMAIVGDCQQYDLVQLVGDTLGSWQGHALPEPEFPSLTHDRQELTYKIQRDQIMLLFGMPSVTRLDADYDKLVLFDQIFGSGVLGSLSSRLFALREATGLFYTINGTMVAGASLQPGKAVVYTLVSPDNLGVAEQAITDMMRTVVDTLTPEEVDVARRAVISSLVKLFETNAEIAQSFLFLKRYGFSADYFQTRIQRLQAITVDEIKDAVRRHLLVDDMSVIRVGRV